MYELNADAKAAIDAFAAAVQAHESLPAYLEEGEDEHYQAIKTALEPQIEQWYNHVAANFPLQIEAFEKALLNEQLEGLFLPRVLGYATLRPEINDYYKYARQPDHLREILLFIAANDNFDQLKQRIGQGLQVAFALGSDIWVSSLINAVGNKRVRQFYQSQRRDDNRTVEGRKRTYVRYARQFRDKNYQSAEFPQTAEEMDVLNKSLQDFLRYRTNSEFDNQSLVAPLNALMTNEALAGHPKLVEIATIYGAYFDLPPTEHEVLQKTINEARSNDEIDAQDLMLSTMLELKNSRKVKFGPEEEQRLGKAIDRSIDDKLTQYFDVMDKVHSKGYVQNESAEAIQAAYDLNPGLSDFNENMRQSIYGYFSRFALNLEPSDYKEWFELSQKQYPVYLKLFSNEAFSQQLKDLYFKFAKKLIKAFPDKRGKDYREIKKTVIASALSWAFMTEKQLKEFFKTPRKKKIKTE
ncbi:MAG: hypothetical protein AAF741_12930 [Bacteroidota bacterium]